MSRALRARLAGRPGGGDAGMPQNKKIEWDRYRTYVSQYEIEEYLPKI